jgi:hypothetical protein
MGDLPKSDSPVTVPDPGGGGHGCIGALATFLAVLGSVLVVFVGIPFALIGFAFWSAEGAWEFEGRGLYYSLFMSGSRAERLGLVEPIAGTVKYSVSLQEGTFPGWAVIGYDSKAAPEAIIEAYAQNCLRLKARITERTASAPTEDKAVSDLACEFEAYLTAEFRAERMPSSSHSRVGMRVWGRE